MSKEKGHEKTKFGKLLAKVGSIFPEVLDIGIKLATGNVGGAIEEFSSIMKKKGEKDERARVISKDFEIAKMDYARELYESEIKDRDSARNREIEMAKTGKSDFMMYVAGFVGLGTFLLLVVAVIFGKSWGLDINANPLFVHLMGMVEGVAITIFMYYFGSSKSSSDKTKLLTK